MKDKNDCSAVKNKSLQPKHSPFHFKIKQKSECCYKND